MAQKYTLLIDVEAPSEAHAIQWLFDVVNNFKCKFLECGIETAADTNLTIDQRDNRLAYFASNAKHADQALQSIRPAKIKEPPCDHSD